MRTACLMLATCCCLCSAAFAAEPARAVVLVGNYQALGVDAKRLAGLEQALRAALESKPVALVAAEETEQLRRSLALCVEDAACLGSVGERAGARWVLGYGAGKVGASVLVNVLWVDVVRGKTIATASRKVAAAAMPTVAGALVDEVLKNVSLLEPVEAPAPAPAPPTPPPAVLVPAEPAAAPVQRVTAPAARPLRSAAIGTGIATAVFTGSTVAFGLLASSNYQRLSAAPINGRAALLRDQRNLNLTADASLGLAIVAAAATVLFVLFDQLGQSK